ncbi:MAG: HAD family phosphatase [Zoogloeaceae bacterium]|jgi:HAD superfamily hydrolase (TIGR01490 family)|nr:HAD family phosphatase [Zoogloeaceae bacterium]
MKLALFDLDNTLLVGDSDYEWGRFLAARGARDPQLQAEATERFYRQYQEGTLDIDEFLRFQLEPLAATPRPTLEAWRARFMAEHVAPMMAAQPGQWVREHLAAGDCCVLVTATNSFVVGPIARAFGFAHLIATVPAVDGDGQFTGQVQGTPSFREGKITRVETWLAEQGLWWSDFSESRFYSDSINDLPLLEKVDTPIAVAPDPKLAAIAQQRGWEIRAQR